MDDKTEDRENQEDADDREETDDRDDLEETDDRDDLEETDDRDDREYKIKLEIDDIMERVKGIMKKIETVYPSGKDETNSGFKP